MLRSHDVPYILLGKDFVEERTSSCEYHLNQTIKKNSKYANDRDQDHQLIYGIRNAASAPTYLMIKNKFDSFIETIPNADQ